jgi:REP element-mobilizing transposase RayT
VSHRLERLDQVYRDDPVYFITACVHERKDLLATPEIHQAFRVFGEEAGHRNILVGRYVLMPDHVHFFVSLAPDQELSVWMKSLKNALSKTLRNKGHAAPHWQKGFSIT